MARTSNTVSEQDEPFSLGRSLVVGAVAGVIACYSFLNMLGYGSYSNSFWRDGPRSESFGQAASPANPPQRTEEQAPESEPSLDPNAPPTDDRQPYEPSQNPTEPDANAGPEPSR